MNTKREIVSLHNVIKNYGHGKIITKALGEINLKILEGEFSAMMGPSGSGKSTLLNIIGGLDRATSGEVKFNGKDFNTLSNKDLSIMRRNHIGFAKWAEGHDFMDVVGGKVEDMSVGGFGMDTIITPLFSVPLILQISFFFFLAVQLLSILPIYLISRISITDELRST